MQTSANEKNFPNNFHRQADDRGFSSEFHDWIQGGGQSTEPRHTQSRLDSRQPTQIDSKTNCDVDMRTDTNITRCFRSGPVMAVDEVQAYDCNFPPLQRDTHTQGGANRVKQKIKSGHTMNPGKVQDSKVTTFSAPSVTRGRSARPHPTLANFLNRLPDKEVSKGLEQMEKTMP